MRLPSGSRNSMERLPQGWLVGSWTQSVTAPRRRGRRSGVVRFHPPRADEGQDAPLGVQFDVIFTSEGGGRVDTGDGLVKRSQCGQVVGDDSQRGELHGDVPFVGCRAGQQPGGRPRETVRYSTVALQRQGEGRPVTRSGADTSGGKADKRVRRSKAAVLAQTYELLSEGGIGGVSIDEVSRRSGVSKTTIYRHWPSRAALLMDACSKIGPAPVIPDTGTLKGDVTALATSLAQQL